ncbi:zinc finger protein Pegasus-like [Peromyscus californicus insignis]|uniref:zinc finger protein Pegasus-like n=1 Tax=Peromyscus californicus insignis TaxID=564181 RepID=UPI0022A76573|nr:zinc finger protein Pegasus-like [Peromyscus californicus insignis]XP_052607587.1 zinc finger protein Pegasus-like [Peromyscus californicus insignis]
MLGDLERTWDGKRQCPYCGYASERTERLVEHTRVHTGEKPHRCRLCPFASAYERYLEAHMRSHTGEKPYKCELCAYRCNYRSNLAHHRRRRHKLLPLTAPRASFTGMKTWGSPQGKSHVEEGKRGLLIALGPPSVVLQKPDHPGDFTHKVPSVRNDFYGSMGKANVCGLPRDPEELLLVDSPLNQMSTLAGLLSRLPPENQNLASPDGDSSLEENLFMIQQPSAQGRTPQSSPIVLEPQLPPFSQRDCSPFAGPSSQPSGRTSTSIFGNSQPSTPALTLPMEDPQLLYHCQHCDTYFADNVLYTIHMGCHGYDNPFQCNICGHNCKNKYDFACHFARGQHN